MTPDLTTLREAVRAATGREPDWEELAFFRNVAPVPTLVDAPGDTVGSRGFHLVVTDGRARITHYLKCRAANDRRAAREADLLEQLSGTAAASCVPRVTVTRGARMQVIAQQAVAGTRLERRLGDRRAADRAPEDAAEILRVMDRIRSVVPHLAAAAAHDAEVDLESSFTALERVGVGSAILATLRTASAETWPWQAQHGDLWPPNVIWSSQGPVLLDFESFGEIGHPMFDAWHLARSGWQASGHQTSWLGILTPQSAVERGWLALLAARQAGRHGAGNDLRPSLAWYAVRIAATLVRRGVPERFSQPYLDDLARVAGLCS